MYVNINGKRYNLDYVYSYKQIENRTIEFKYLSGSQHVEYIDIMLNFATENQAKQCIEFLDTETKCKTFVLKK